VFGEKNTLDTSGIAFASPRIMSGLTASQALQQRFDTIRRTELERLKKKLAGLSDADREFVDQITADLVRALTCGPEKALAQDSPLIAVEALVTLFALEA
jgi:hypothetical protein